MKNLKNAIKEKFSHIGYEVDKDELKNGLNYCRLISINNDSEVSITIQHDKNVLNLFIIKTNKDGWKYEFKKFYFTHDDLATLDIYILLHLQ